MPREMALKIRFVDGDGLNPGRLEFAVEFHNAIHHEERIAMREDVHDGIDVERSGRGGNRLGCCRGNGIDTLGEKFCHFGIDAMAGFDSHDMAANETPAEREVADDVENLVANEFIGEAKRLLAENTVTTGNDGVFEASALDEAFIHERLDILVENKGSGGSYFLFVNLRGDLRGAELCETPLGTDLRAGDAEF